MRNLARLTGAARRIEISQWESLAVFQFRRDAKNVLLAMRANGFTGDADWQRRTDGWHIVVPVKGPEHLEALKSRTAGKGCE